MKFACNSVTVPEIPIKFTMIFINLRVKCLNFVPYLRLPTYLVSLPSLHGISLLDNSGADDTFNIISYVVINVKLKYKPELTLETVNNNHN